ncbi:MAG: DUF192 domain-containing protein [Nanoarchaeota archaeon]
MIKIIGICILLLLLVGCRIQGEEGIVIEVNDKTWVAEIADSPAEQQQGLMFRESLPANKGMLFVFNDSEPRTFWMKNTKIPLDMIFIDANWRVVSVVKTATPCISDPCQLYNSTKPAKYVLEVNAGEAVEKGVKVGTRVQTSLKK